MSEGTPPSINGLAHGTYLCPGLHGKGAVRQDVQRKSFADLLAGASRLVIPAFQRSYCWHERLAQSWWRDIHSGSRFNGQHSTGKAIFFPAADEGHTMLVIDGQQRLTTACLCIAAVRDRALVEIAALPGGDASTCGQLERLVEVLNRLLYRDVDAAHEWCKVAAQRLAQAQCGLDGQIWDDLLRDGDCPIFFSLIPSFHDRVVFSRLLLEGPCAHMAGVTLRLASRRPAEVVKAWFDRAVDDFCRNRSGLALVKALEQTARGATELMGVMSVRAIEPPPGLAQQVFLWYQENALMGDGALLKNPCPGVMLAASDLARNLVLAPLLSMGTGQMDMVMRDHWFPIERRFQSPIHFDAFLQRFVNQPPIAPPSASVAHFAAIIEGLRMNTNKDPDDLKRLELYTQFVSTYDRLLSTYHSALAEGVRAGGYPANPRTEDNIVLGGARAVMAALQHFADAELSCESSSVPTIKTMEAPPLGRPSSSPVKRPLVPVFNMHTISVAAAT